MLHVTVDVSGAHVFICCFLIVHVYCRYCPGGPDSDFEYSTQSYTGYEVSCPVVSDDCLVMVSRSSLNAVSVAQLWLSLTCLHLVR